MKDTLIIAIDGIDGAGKDFQAIRLRNWLIKQGYNTIICANTGTDAGKKVLRPYINQKFNLSSDKLASELFHLMFKDLVAGTIQPHLKGGKRAVIMVRSVHSAIAYQGAGDGVGEEFIKDLYASDKRSRLDYDVAIHINVSIATAKIRGRLNPHITNDRYERKNYAYYYDVLNSFNNNTDLAQVNGELDADLVTDAILDIVKGKMK